MHVGRMVEQLHTKLDGFVDSDITAEEIEFEYRHADHNLIFLTCSSDAAVDRLLATMSCMNCKIQQEQPPREKRQPLTLGGLGRQLETAQRMRAEDVSLARW
eukprot:1295686-Amphidinium_carterae.1